MQRHRIALFTIPCECVSNSDSLRCVHCVVTAGPAFEPIDEVRRITNHSTGRLGCALADSLVRGGHRVTLLLSDTALHRPRSAAIEIVRFSTSADLKERLRENAQSEIGGVFHAAAVADFRVAGVRPAGPLRLSPRIEKERKLPTRTEGYWLRLVPAPKLIGSLRRWFPSALLVGWKFEVEGQAADALSEGRSQLVRNKTDVCVVNGPAYGEGFGVVTRREMRHAPNPTRLFRELLGLLNTRT